MDAGEHDAVSPRAPCSPDVSSLCPSGSARLLRMNHDVPTGDRRARGGGVRGVRAAARRDLVVVHDHAAVAVVPDLDPELVRAPAAVHGAVDGGQDEAVVAGVVDGARALVLGPGARHDEPVVDRAVEVQVADLELELRLARRYVRALLVLGYEPEVGASGEQGVRYVRARR